MLLRGSPLVVRSGAAVAYTVGVVLKEAVDSRPFRGFSSCDGRCAAGGGPTELCGTMKACGGCAAPACRWGGRWGAWPEKDMRPPIDCASEIEREELRVALAMDSVRVRCSSSSWAADDLSMGSKRKAAE